MKIGRIPSRSITNDVRLNGGYFLNENAVNSRIIESNSDKSIQLAQIANVFNPPIFKRQFCQNTERAVPYCQSSDVTNAHEGSDIYINKQQAEKIGAVVKKNQILVTGFGTIGNVRLVNELSQGIAYANNVCRIEVYDNNYYGYVYAFLASKYGRAQLNKNSSGSVVLYIEAPGIKKTLIPLLEEEKQKEIHQLIVDGAQLRVNANRLLEDAKQELKEQAKLPDLTTKDYEYFGNHSSERDIAVFTRNFKELSSLTINAFNYSRKIESLENRIRNSGPWSALKNVIQNGVFFSTGSFPRLELQTNRSIQLINQSDIFDIKMKGKLIARKFVKTDKLVEYGEVLIAGVGTLGENETFCRVIFANEELEGKLVSGEFIRMKAERVPSGYLYAFLSTDYGFRMIRKTQTGTKLCRPIQALLSEIPVPLLDLEKMNEIDEKVKKGQTYLYNALQKETQAIQQIENEIASWQVS